jgi:hypothetical protein
MPGARKKTEEGNADEDKYLPRYVSNHTHFSTTDAGARVSVKPGKPRQLNYLGQVTVDTSHHVITNIEAHLEDKKGSQSLPYLNLSKASEVRIATSSLSNFKKIVVHKPAMSYAAVSLLSALAYC